MINLRTRSRAAFTLVEIVAGMAILAMGLAATSSAMVTAISVQDFTQDMERATEAIENRLELIQTKSYDDVFNLYNGDAFDIDGLNLIDDSGRKHIEVTVDNTTIPDALIITFDAAWTSRDTPGKLVLTYYLVDRRE